MELRTNHFISRHHFYSVSFARSFLENCCESNELRLNTNLTPKKRVRCRFFSLSFCVFRQLIKKRKKQNFKTERLSNELFCSLFFFPFFYCPFYQFKQIFYKSCFTTNRFYSILITIFMNELD